MGAQTTGVETFLSVTFSVLRSLVRFLASFIVSLKGFAKKQFLAGLLFCLSCAWWNCLSQIYVDKMHWAHFKAGDSRTLPDIGFILLPYLNMPHLPDVWNMLIVLGTLLPVIFIHPAKVKIMRRFAAVQGTCFLLRSVTIMATILPNPFAACVNSSSSDEIPAIEAFKVMLGMRHTCGDVLYSGHAANFTLMALVWQEYGPTYFPSMLTTDVSTSSVATEGSTHRYSPEWWTGVFFPRFFWGVAIVGYFIIIACRFHYTVDVLVGIVVVAKQWGLYHMIIRTPKQLAKVPFLAWFEEKRMHDGIQEDDRSDEGSEQFGFEETPRIKSSLDMSSHQLLGVGKTRRLVALGTPTSPIQEMGLVEEGRRLSENSLAME